MQKHIDVFFYLNLFRNKHLPVTKEIHRQLLQSWLETPMNDTTADRVEQIFTQYPPDNTQKARWLRDNGYSPSFIGKYLNITPGTVSYHLGRRNSEEYINGILLQYLQNINRPAYRNNY
jgi:hypothetical protein